MDKLSTQFLDLGDVRLAYREHGDGRALLLLHGNSGSKAMFKKYQLEHFRDYHTIAVDSRGHGQSVSQDGSKFSIKQYADDMARFCAAKGITEAYVIGYSDGGNIALWLASLAPQVFRKVLAISPNTLVSGSTDESLKQIRGVTKALEFLGKCGLNTRKQLMKMQLMLQDIGISDAELGSIHIRLKIIYAEKDMIKEEHILQIGGLIPEAQVKKIERCTHLSIPHKPEAIEEMREFLAAG